MGLLMSTQDNENKVGCMQYLPSMIMTVKARLEHYTHTYTCTHTSWTYYRYISTFILTTLNLKPNAWMFDGKNSQSGQSET